jgi:electron transfer flavoprotein alpha subunit
MAYENGILVYGEAKDGRLLSITAELLNVGRQLADSLAQPLSAALIGEGTTGLAQDAIALGADKVFVADDAIFAEYLHDLHVPAAVNIAKEVDPNIILAGQTAIGRDLAPHLAFYLDTGIAIDCTALEIDSGTKRMRATRPFSGGNFRQNIGIKTQPQMATIRSKAIDGAVPDASRTGEVIKVNHGVDASQSRMKFIEAKPVESEGVRLEDADIVVSGGRGIGGPEGFEGLEELAAIFGGAVGGSRAATDSGFTAPERMVGITGVIVAPNLYMAIGISGASQHLAGCGGAKTIVAINTDEEAQIFGSSSFGVVGDYKQVIPAFTEEVKKLLQG